MFDPQCATVLGVERAILIHNIMFWISKNSANNKHLYDDRYWMYNSSEAFAKMHPYWSIHKIGRMLRSLENEGWLISANHNLKGYDRTKWYAVTDQTILQNWIVHSAKLQNASFRIAEPIPYKNHINTNIPPTPPSHSSGAAEVESEIAEKEKASDQKQPAPQREKKRAGSSRFVPPSAEEVSKYVAERVALGKPRVDAESFVDFYETKGWMVGKNKMKNWQAAVRTWERSRGNGSSGNNSAGGLAV